MADNTRMNVYGRKWRAARASYLKLNPLCVEHKKQGLIVAATVVDHIIPHRMNMELFWNKNNWQSLCAQCHSRHKQRLEKSGKVIGCSIDGLPIDTKHHWNK